MEPLQTIRHSKIEVGDKATIDLFASPSSSIEDFENTVDNFVF